MSGPRDGPSRLDVDSEWRCGSLDEALGVLPGFLDIASAPRPARDSRRLKMRASIAKGFAVLALVALTSKAPAATPNGGDIVVRVHKHGGGLDVYAALTVAATPRQTWAVLVDYDHMDEILSNVDASRIVRRAGNRLEVAQRSHVGFGPLKLSLSNRRRVELIPQREIRSHLIEGDVKASDFTTRLVNEGGTTRAIWRGRIVLGPVSGLVVTADTVKMELRQMCQELRGEILRRKARPTPSHCRLAAACD